MVDDKDYLDLSKRQVVTSLEQTHTYKIFFSKEKTKMMYNIKFQSSDGYNFNNKL